MLIGKAAYFYTGRPMANQHQSWRDLYVMYAKSHYVPAFDLMLLYLIYWIMAKDFSGGHLPMILVVLSFICWLSSPLWFSPYPRPSLIIQDMQDFAMFILGKSGMNEQDIDDVLERQVKNEFRNVYEMGLADQLNTWSQRTCFTTVLSLALRVLCIVYANFILPASVLDYIFVFALFTPIQWFLLVMYLSFDNNNVILLISCVLWFCVPLATTLVIGSRVNLGFFSRGAEYLLAAIVYSMILGAVRALSFLMHRMSTEFRQWCCCGIAKADPVVELENLRKFHQWVRIAYIFAFDYQFRFIGAMLILLWKIVLSIFMMLLDLPQYCGLFGIHSYVVLNTETATSNPRKGYMETEIPDESAQQMEELTKEVKELRQRLEHDHIGD